MATHGKRFRAAVALVDRERFYQPGEAVALVKQTAKAKGYFKQLVEMCKGAGTERPELQYARKNAN